MLRDHHRPSWSGSATCSTRLEGNGPRCRRILLVPAPGCQASLARFGSPLRTLLAKPVTESPANLQRRAAHRNHRRMGFAGFLAGGYVGAKVEGDCACDDPGLQGFIIGAPIGAAAGAIFGAWPSR